MCHQARLGSEVHTVELPELFVQDSAARQQAIGPVVELNDFAAHRINSDAIYVMT